MLKVKSSAAAALAALLFLAPGVRAERAADSGSESLTLELPDGGMLEVRLRKPKADPPPGTRLPALMVFGGFQEAARVLDLIDTDDPVILASFDYPFSPPRKFRFPESLRYAPEARRTLHRSVEGIALLARRLAERPDVDPRRITVIGASLGAPLAAVAAGRSSEISGLVMVHGFGRVPRTIAHQFVRKWEPRYGWAAKPAAWLLGQAAWWYIGLQEPEQALRTLGPGKRVLVVSAEQDSFVPLDASESIWKAAENSDAVATRIILPGDHVQPGSHELVTRILSRTREWMKNNLLLSESEDSPNAE